MNDRRISCDRICQPLTARRPGVFLPGVRFVCLVNSECCAPFAMCETDGAQHWQRININASDNSLDAIMKYTRTFGVILTLARLCDRPFLSSINQTRSITGDSSRSITFS
jgi:hypothetical protein